MNKTVLELTGMEATQLGIHLHEELDKTKVINGLIDKKFQLIEEILFAIFGFKSSIWGFQRKQPYFSNKHIELVRELDSKITDIKRIEEKKKYLNEVFKKLSAAGFSVESNYISAYIKIEERWNALDKRYNDDLKVGKSLYELKKIISDLLSRVK